MIVFQMLFSIGSDGHAIKIVRARQSAIEKLAFRNGDPAFVDFFLGGMVMKFRDRNPAISRQTLSTSLTVQWYLTSFFLKENESFGFKALQ